MDGPQTTRSVKGVSHERTDTGRFHCQEVGRANSETESGSVVARAWGRASGELVFNGDEFPFGKMTAFWRMKVIVRQCKCT